MTFSLLKYGDPRLKERAEPVGVVDDYVRGVVQQIIQTMEEHQAIGLSAVHIGVFLRIIVVQLDPSDPPEVWINPKLSDPSSERRTEEEGSISLPGVRAPVERPIAITVSGQNLDGNPATQRCEGLYARVVMHENDQLNGVFFTERVRGKARKVLDQRLRRA